MKFKPINNEKNYLDAMVRIEEIFDAKKGTAEGDELEIISILIEHYEDDQFPIGLPDPIE